MFPLSHKFVKVLYCALIIRAGDNAIIWNFGNTVSLRRRHKEAYILFAIKSNLKGADPFEIGRRTTWKTLSNMNDLHWLLDETNVIIEVFERGRNWEIMVMKGAVIR